MGIGLAVILLGSCELLFAPKQPRDNPSDPNNPVPALEAFSAVAISESEIRLTVSFPDQADAIAGFLVIRGAWETPDSVSDEGESFRMIEFPVTETELIDDVDIKADVEYWYSIWTYGAGKLGDHYTFSGTDYAKTFDPGTKLGSFYSFNAYPTSANEIYLNWDFSGNSPDIGSPPHYLLVRKEGGSPPADQYDGERIFIKDDWQHWDWGVESNTLYSYAIWPADGDGSAYPEDSLNPTQSAWDSADTTPIRLPDYAINKAIVSLDEDSNWWDLPPNVRINSSTSPHSVALLRFDISHDMVRYFGNLHSASIFMKSSDVDISGEVRVLRIVQEWDTGSNLTWEYVTGDLFSFDDGLGISTTIQDSGIEYSWDVVELIHRGARGFMIQAKPDNPLDVTFEVSGAGPEPWLVASFYGEI